MYMVSNAVHWKNKHLLWRALSSVCSANSGVSLVEHHKSMSLRGPIKAGCQVDLDPLSPYYGAASSFKWCWVKNNCKKIHNKSKLIQEIQKVRLWGWDGGIMRPSRQNSNQNHKLLLELVQQFSSVNCHFLTCPSIQYL